MTTTLAFNGRARVDVENAIEWYEAQQNGLGARFIGALNSATHQLIAWPRAGPFVNNTRRCLRVRGFPYALFYYLDGQRILVARCLHDRQDVRNALKEN